MITVDVIKTSSDLVQVVEEINSSLWDEDNEMSKYDIESLTVYLQRQDTFFLTCHNTSSGRPTLLGVASARLEIKPYEMGRWLYVDEVDVCSNHRQLGAGKALMSKLIEIATAEGCDEVWLGTEKENVAANALYQSMCPHDVAEVIGYTYGLKGGEK